MSVPKNNLDKIISVLTAESEKDNYFEGRNTRSKKKANTSVELITPIIMPVYGNDDWVSLQTVMTISDIWDKVEVLEVYGACNICFWGVEGIIN